METRPLFATLRTRSGQDPLLFRLMVPLGVLFLISLMLSDIRRYSVNGSPSHPWPKLTMASGALLRCLTAMETISSLSGRNEILWCDDLHELSGWRERHPIQSALPPLLPGRGASHLFSNRFLAAKQWLLTAQLIRCSARGPDTSLFL